MFFQRLRLKKNILFAGQPLLWAALFFIAYPVFADERIDSVYRIVAHHARIQLFPATSDIQCNDTMTVLLTTAPEEITLKILPIYTIENLTVNGGRGKYRRQGIYLSIENLPGDSILQVIIAYSGRFSYRSEFSSLTSDRAVFRDAELLPTGISCLEDLRLSVTVPSEWEVIAPGSLALIGSEAESSTYVWENHHPIPEIGWICAGKFWHREQIAGPTTVSFHLFENDSSSAISLYPLIRDVLQFYSDKFSPYRFPILSIVEVEDWVAGKNVLAIASPSVIMVKKLAFTTNDQFNKIESVLAHEIAHQWFPLTVFIDDRDAAFLAEGLCEYSSILFHESYGSMSRRDSLNRHPLLRPLIMRALQGNDAPLQQRTDLRSMVTQYLKASYVHNMLRREIGDSTFLRLYREYVNRFSLKRVNLSNFQSLAEELSGKNLNWFFQQWVEGRGIPRIKTYNVKSVEKTDGWHTEGRVRIVGYEKFTLHGEVQVLTVQGEATTEFRLGVDSSQKYRNDTPFDIVTGSKPVKVILDPAGDILKMQELPPKLSDLREPTHGILIIGTQQHQRYLRKLALQDSAELAEAGWTFTVRYDSSVTLNDLQNERVFLYGTSAENHVVADLEKKFPVSFQNDSLVIGQEKLYDSTLTLIEVIDNPYFAHGLIVWIAPMSERADPALLPYDASWIVVRGKNEISSGIWEVEDENLIVEIK